MKKELLAVLSAMVLLTAGSAVFAKTNINSDLAEAIKFYKQGNYTQCQEKLEASIKKDPSNSLTYYYMGMTAAHMGKKEEAIENYDKALTLAPSNSNLIKYAEKGKRCLESPEACHEVKYENSVDEFIRGKSTDRFSEEARSMFEKLKIEQMMRDINRQGDVDPQKFREYKDFSSMNTPSSDVPSNDEIAQAVRTLQKAGLMNFGGNSYSDLSILTGNDSSMINMMYSGNMNPQLIQEMLTNNMSLGF